MPAMMRHVPSRCVSTDQRIVKSRPSPPETDLSCHELRGQSGDANVAEYHRDNR